MKLLGRSPLRFISPSWLAPLKFSSAGFFILGFFLGCSGFDGAELTDITVDGISIRFQNVNVEAEFLKVQHVLMDLCFGFAFKGFFVGGLIHAYFFHDISPWWFDGHY